MEVAALLNDTERMNKIKDFVTKSLDLWFGIGDGNPAFVFDQTWGGIILRSDLNFSDANGRFFAHHAYYGYFANAFASLAKYHYEYYASRAAFIEPIIADFAGTCAFDYLPCKPRNKDAFLGLSMNEGIGDVDEETQKYLTSPAMAVNAYFGIRELGKALKNKTLEDLGNYLLSSEIVAAQTYRQIKQPSDIYASPFADSGVVGSLTETKADYASIFGANRELAYGIQMLL
jgi:endoglucanase Acf2